MAKYKGLMCPGRRNIDVRGDIVSGRDLAKARLKKAKCPECGRKVLPKIHSCGDWRCWHVDIPPHKPKHWFKRPKTGRNQRRWGRKTVMRSGS